MKRIALVLGFQYLSTPPPAADSPESRRLMSNQGCLLTN